MPREAILMMTTISKMARFDKFHPTLTLLLKLIPTAILISALAQIPTDHADGKETQSPLRDPTADTMINTKTEMNTDTVLSRRHTHTDQRRTHSHNDTAIKTLRIATSETTQRTRQGDIPHCATPTTPTTITPPHPTPRPHHATTEWPNN